jgi:hypothetical protein
LNRRHLKKGLVLQSVFILFCDKLNGLSLAKSSNAGSNPATGLERENGKIAISKLSVRQCRGFYLVRLWPLAEKIGQAESAKHSSL